MNRLGGGKHAYDQRERPEYGYERKHQASLGGAGTKQHRGRNEEKGGTMNVQTGRTRRDRKVLERACALVLQGWACVEVTEDDVDEDESGDVEVGAHLVGTHIAQCIPTAQAALGYNDVVRHGKGIVDGTPTVRPGDYAGGVELWMVDHTFGFNFDNAVEEECTAGDEDDFNGPVMERAQLAVFGYERDGGNIHGPIGGHGPVYGNLSQVMRARNVTMEEMRGRSREGARV